MTLIRTFERGSEPATRTERKVHYVREVHDTHRVAACGSILPVGFPVGGPSQRDVPKCRRCF